MQATELQVLELSHAGSVTKEELAGNTRKRRTGIASVRFIPGWIFAALLLALPGGLFAQQFEHIDSLYFTRSFGAPDPLPQIVPIATSTGAIVAFSVTPTTSTTTVPVGNWLVASPVGNVCCNTPRAVTISVNTGVNGPAMPAGTYTGQVVFSSGGIPSLTVAVTFVIAQAANTFFDNMPGQVSFSMKPGGQPPSQVLQIRNGGTGSLSWSLTTTAFNGDTSWLTVSATSGTAPSVITVGIVAANLPSGGTVAGIFSGQLLIQTAGGASIVTVPIGVTVAANAMPQVNALSFTKPFGGNDPLPQTVTISNGGTGVAFSISSVTATGSNGGTSWLSVLPTGNVCCVSPRAITISPVPAIALAAGTYTGQVVAETSTQSMVIPIYLNIGAASAAFFDNITGQLSFFLQTGATKAPPNQLLQIRGAGTGALNWTLTTTTFDSANWLTVSDSNDTAPTQISVGIVPSSLPNGALTAGVYTANLLFQAAGTSVTVPITVQVGTTFEQVNGINFTMLQTGPDPLPQNITINNTGAPIAFSVNFSTATGGNWLTVSPAGNVCCVTPRSLEVSVIAPPTMPAGTYTAEIVVYSSTTSMTVPVTLTVATAANPYFDNLPGEMTFFMQTSAPQPPANQVFQIRNAGGGALNWTITPTTFDGGSWLTVLPALSGAAPALITVGIVPGSLPNGGLVAGVFVGQLLLQSGGSSVTIPVIVDVGTNIFGQMNAIDFTMPQAGVNPLPQVLTVTSTGTAFAFSVIASTSTGGNWLSVSPFGNVCCVTPRTLTVTVNAAPTLPAGIYTGQISIYSSTVSQTVAVTLTVAPTNTPFFDNVPGALSYSLVTAAGNPPPQNLQIRNRGTGNLNWTAQVFTSDGGNWLTISSAGGTAPSQVSVGIVTQNLQNQGLVAGLFTGQVLFLSGNSSSVTVPVSVRVGGNGFAQINGINFTMPLAGANPLPQNLTTTSIGGSFAYSVSAQTANGGSWLTVSPVGNVCCTTPEVETVTVSAPVGLVAGTYTGQVIVDAATSVNVVPVTLTVAPLNSPFFDNVQGQMSFFAPVTSPATTPTSQSMLVQNFGSGELDWNLTAVTADSGNWLIPSITLGAAPSNITVSINPANLPNQGLVAGQFTGQLLFQANGSSVTVPVSVQLGSNIFTQKAGLSFSMPYGGGSPLPQVLSVTSAGSAFATSNTFAAANGGNWLSIAPFGNVCCTTPENITFTVNGAPGGVAVPAGIHTGQAVFNTARSAMTVPVILTVQGTPKWSITKTHNGNFTAGQSNATYTVTVSNQTGPSVGPSNGTATLTETVPNGMTLVSLVGTGWTCGNPNPANVCTRIDALAPGASYPTITVTVNVNANVQSSLTNQVSVSGAGSLTANASDLTSIITKCDLNQNGTSDIVDVQAIINQALGLAPAVNDLNQDGVVNIVDIQIVINAALGLTCTAI